ncbi:MAG: C69 family dipeptidase, partial [Bacteroidales bacterium]
MKKTIRNLCFIAGVGFLTGLGSAQACTNFLITKGASKDGSTMITYSADSHVLYGELYYRPAATYAEGTMMDIYDWDSGRKLGQIK